LLIFAKWLASKQIQHVLLLLTCLDNKKPLSLETVMATNPWMYSRTQKSNMKKKKKKKIAGGFRPQSYSLSQDSLTTIEE
jgi:hypothetical protein